LFQAEARRCKEILDLISGNKTASHFCVFDELYSGTNPEEAVTSATAFMEYMIKNPEVYCMLTTHFVDICRKLSKNAAIENCNMLTTKNDNKMKYTYKLTPGVSTVKGGVNILADMDYPEEIIQRASMPN
jgi:DNA mismatch repair protein MutS